MTDKKTEALKLAQEALTKNSDRVTEIRAKDKAITAIREALAEQPAQQQEPVAYIRKDQLQKAAQSPILCEVTPEPRKDRLGIYTSPPAQQQESCGWRMRHNGVWAYSFTKDAWDFIYAVSPAARKAARDNAPASKPWVGLTDEERGQVYANWRFNGSGSSNLELCRAIEAKLREKNAAPRKPLTDEQHSLAHWQHEINKARDEAYLQGFAAGKKEAKCSAG